MTDPTAIIGFVKDVGFTGILIILAVPKLRKIFFNGDSDVHQPQIDELKEHAKIANSEMGQVVDRLDEIEKDVSFIRGKLS